MVEPQFKNDECGNRAVELFNQRISDKYVSSKILFMDL